MPIPDREFPRHPQSRSGQWLRETQPLKHIQKETSMPQLPKIEDFKSSDGEELRQLFALSVLRALTPMERNSVLKSLHSTGEHQ